MIITTISGQYGEIIQYEEEHYINSYHASRGLMSRVMNCYKVEVINSRAYTISIKNNKASISPADTTELKNINKTWKHKEIKHPWDVCSKLERILRGSLNITCRYYATLKKEEQVSD